MDIFKSIGSWKQRRVSKGLDWTSKQNSLITEPFVLEGNTKPQIAKIPTAIQKTGVAVSLRQYNPALMEDETGSARPTMIEMSITGKLPEILAATKIIFEE